MIRKTMLVVSLLIGFMVIIGCEARKTQSPPVIAANTPVGSQTGNITINCTLYDLQADLCEVDVRYSEDGGVTWQRATLVSSSNGDVSGNVITSIWASVASEPFSFVWDSVTDIGVAYQDDIRIKVVPKDNMGYYGLASETGDFTVNANGAPVAAISDPGGPQSGDVYINFTLSDTDSETCSVVVDYSEDGGIIWHAATLVGASSGIVNGNEISQLSTTPSATSYVLIWDSVTDVGVLQQDDIQLRITPTDNLGLSGASAQTSNFTVNYNDAPLAAVIDPVGSQSGDVTIRFNLSDSQADTCNVDIFFSEDSGATWRPATVRSVSKGSVSGNTVNNIDTTAVPAIVSFVWDSVTDIGTGYQADIQIRVVPNDGQLTGVPSDTSDFTVNYNDGPVIVVSSPVGVQSGPVAIDFTLADAQGDICSVRVDFSQDGGVTYSPATIASSSAGTINGNTINNLSASAVPTAYDFIWFSSTDLGDAHQTDIRIRLTPNDGTDNGAASATTDFEINYNHIPVVSIQTPSGVQNGDITFAYTIEDSDSDTSSVTVLYSEDAGASWAAATLVNASIGSVAGNVISGIPATASPVTYDFVWDSLGDIGTVYQTDIQVKIIANDGTLDGSPAFTADFAVNGNNLPVVTVTDPVGVVGGDVTIDFDLMDLDSDICSVKVEVSVDSGANWVPAILAGASAGVVSYDTIYNLPAAPAAIPYTLIWDSYSNFGNSYYTTVRIRLTPNDGYDTGAAVSTNDFTLDNNNAPGVFAQAPAGTQTGDATIQFALADVESNMTQVTVEFSTDGGATWTNATIKTASSGSISGNVISNLPTTPAVIWYSFVWDSFLDNVALTQLNYNVKIRLTPNDGFEDGAISVSDAFIVDNVSIARWLFPADNVSNNSSSSQRPAIKTDSSGVVHVVWADNNDGDYDIWYSNYNGVAWSAPANISNDATDATNPAITVDSSDNLHVVWQDTATGNSDIYYSVSSDGGSSWSGAAIVATNAGASVFPDITTGPDADNAGFESIFVVWQDDSDGDNDIYFMRNQGSGWVDMANLSDNTAEATSPSIVVTGNWHRHVIWADDSTGVSEIYYKTYNDRFGPYVWQISFQLTNNTASSIQPRVAIRSGDRPAIVWADDQSGNMDIYYRECRDPDDFWDWGGSTNISNTAGMTLYPDIAYDSNFLPKIVYQDNTSGTWETNYIHRTSAGTWTKAINISNTSGSSRTPRIAVDNSDGLHAVWQDDTLGNDEIYYSEK